MVVLLMGLVMIVGITDAWNVKKRGSEPYQLSPVPVVSSPEVAPFPDPNLDGFPPQQQGHPNAGVYGHEGPIDEPTQ